MQKRTNAIHKGENNCNEGVVTPVDHSTTFYQRNILYRGDYFYARLDNPTTRALETKIAALEDAKCALAFSSGMAAITTTISALLRTKGEIVACEDLYGGTRLFLNTLQERMGIRIRYVDARDAANVCAAITQKTCLVLLESPSNPLLKLCPLEDMRVLKAQYPNVVFIVDNTFATPLGQWPLDYHMDISLHSMTKFINGHSNVIAGAILTNDVALQAILFDERALRGSILSPSDAERVSQNIKTLHLRMRQHEKNALEIAKFLARHRLVKTVLYPGHPSHPQHQLAMKQMKNFGGVITIELYGDASTTRAFMEALKIITPAVSLGGVESLAEAPFFMTHGKLSLKEKNELRITETMVRLSIGIEDCGDLIKDLNEALKSSGPNI